MMRSRVSSCEISKYRDALSDNPTDGRRDAEIMRVLLHTEETGQQVYVVG